MRPVDPDRRAVTALVLVAVLLVGSFAAPIAGTVAAQNGTETPTPTNESGSGDVVDVGSGSNETNESNSGPAMAQGLRLSPVAFDKEYARIDTVESGEQFNVTGPLAVFASNIDIQSSRVAQPNAESRVLDGQRTVEVKFDDAAAPDGSSYFELELFFDDGSSHVVDLYATKTDLIVASVNMQDANALVEQMKEDAEGSDEDYNVDERGVAAAEDYYEDTKQTAELLSNLFGPTLQQFQIWLIATVSSALAIIFFCLLLIFLFRRVKKGHGWKLESLVNTPDLEDLKRQAMTFARLEDRQEAAEHPLHDVSQIGRDHVYWIDAADVHTVKQLADLFHFGQVRFEDGEIVRDEDDNPVMEHEGIDDLLRQDRMRDTWLEPLIRDGMLTEQDAIAHGKAALDLMQSRYSEPGYRESRLKTRQLLDDLSEGRTYGFATGTSGTGGISGRTTGADD